MPQVGPKTKEDRSKHTLTNVRSRLNGDLILAPDDLLEGLGEFRELDEKGNHRGAEIGRPESPDGKSVYVGRSADCVTRQNTCR